MPLFSGFEPRVDGTAGEIFLRVGSRRRETRTRDYGRAQEIKLIQNLLAISARKDRLEHSPGRVYMSKSGKR